MRPRDLDEADHGRRRTGPAARPPDEPAGPGPHWRGGPPPAEPTRYDPSLRDGLAGLRDGSAALPTAGHAGPDHRRPDVPAPRLAADDLRWQDGPARPPAAEPAYPARDQPWTAAARPLDEPTDLLPTVAPRRTPPPPPRVEARAVIVYEPEPRRSWGLWVFTGLLVALTVGVILGQTATFQPVSRPASASQVEATPSYTPPPPPPPPPTVTEPLGDAKAATIEIGGAAALLQVRAADLGPMLFSATAPGGGPVPGVERARGGPRLTVGTHTELLLNAKVTWTLKITGKFGVEQIDLRAGTLARLDLAGDSPDAALDLPRPAKTVPLRVTGKIGKLQIRAQDPVRVRLGKGATSAVVEGTPRGKIGPGTTLTGKGWRSAKQRYDVTAAEPVDAVLVDRTG